MFGDSTSRGVDVMNLAQLAIACFAYGAMTGYDDSLAELWRLLGQDPDLSEASHRQAMLTWLNHWQCRQFALRCHPDASRELLEWYQSAVFLSPPRDRRLWEVPANELDQYAEVFDSLANKRASTRVRAGKSSVVRFGPTAAAKILFALCPGVFLPWDEPMRKATDSDGSGRSYLKFLSCARADLLDLQIQCREFGFELQDLPRVLERPDFTPTKLLDEYHWTTMTNEVVLPNRERVERWLGWFGARLDE
jgi:hypothetical protein